ncbi:MAG: hypothetical protein Q8R76_00430 [Candidatus Omnitrophota bacterium]|nr:hypothetical protein [Candidatus Omnitrophota bacterium]
MKRRLIYLILAALAIGALVYIPRMAVPPSPVEKKRMPQTVAVMGEGDEEQQAEVFGKPLPRKLNFIGNTADTTGAAHVRKTNVTTGLEYTTTERTTVGVGISKEINDPGDAAATGKRSGTEETAAVKYSLKF